MKIEILNFKLLYSLLTIYVCVCVGVIVFDFGRESKKERKFCTGLRLNTKEWMLAQVDSNMGVWSFQSNSGIVIDIVNNTSNKSFV